MSRKDRKKTPASQTHAMRPFNGKHMVAKLLLLAVLATASGGGGGGSGGRALLAEAGEDGGGRMAPITEVSRCEEA